jgi:Peptidase family M28/PA domain
VPTTALSTVEQAIVTSVSRERLMADTAGIAQWVRLSGTEDERKAFEYVANLLRQLGVEPTLYLGYGYISLPESAELQVGGRALRAITHAMAASTPAQGVRLPAVYVGNGTAAEYAAQDVHGKAVVVDGMAMPPKVLAAERAGAAACIFANRDEHVHEMIVSSIWGSPTPEDKHLLPHVPVVSLGRADGDMLRGMLTRLEPVEVHLVTRVDTRWREIPTLIAQVDGREEPQKFVLLSGHLDSWHYGAMDNGSANATMLETLQVLLPYRHTFRRGLRLAFWSGHSHGRYAGSTWYADTFWEDLHDHCVVHINVDSVGGRNATVLTEAPVMAETRACAADVIRAVAGVDCTGTRFGRAGDQSFQGHGIPSLFMSLSEQPPSEGDAARGLQELTGGRPQAKSGGLGWWWHTPEDTVDKIDPDFLVRDTQIYAAVTYRFLSAPLLPLNVQASAEDLLHHLQVWQQKAGDRFDLATVTDRAAEVAGLAAQFQARVNAAAAQRLTPEVARQLNAAITAVERPLVRLNYVQTDPYAHDPALSEPPGPLLAPLELLLATAPGSDADHEVLTLLVRRRNRIRHELAEARQAIAKGLAIAEQV